MKPLVTALAIISLVVLPAGGAFAAVNPGPACTTLSRTLARGSSGTDVSSLQRFLVAQNYPGGGSWMVTGYYGLATQVAVQNFQISAGLSQTGTVDSATRAAIQSYSCGYSNTNTSYLYNPYNYSYTYPYDTYSYNQYGSTGIVLGASTGPNYSLYTNNCSYYNCGTQGISLSYLTPSTGNTGSDVTVYGYGFSETNNTVHFGTGIVPFVRSSQNGTVLSFTVPSTLTGYGNNQNVYNGQSYDVYVTNANGQNSNRATFTVSGLGSYGNGPTLSNVTGPNSLNINQSGTWTVSVYGPVNAVATVDVVWGDEYQPNVSGTTKQSVFLGTTGAATISLTHTYTQSGTYSPVFIASNSYTSNSLTRSVFVGGGSNWGNVQLNSLSPYSGQVGSQVVLYGSGFTTQENTVHFGIGGVRSVTSLANGTALYFTVPRYISTCDTALGSCNGAPTSVTPGSYPVYVSNNNGTTAFDAQHHGGNREQKAILEQLLIGDLSS